MKSKQKIITNKSTLRESNIELMRIISMFFIVIYHIFLHGNIFDRTSGTLRILITIIECILLVHVNSFIIATGYFQCKNKRKMKKVISIINTTWFYKVIIMIALITIKFIRTPSKINIFHTILPLDYGTYWYINCYIILYLISPILNIIIEKCNKKELQKVIITLFFIISFLSIITKDVFFNASGGRSVSTFILLYFIGAYLRIYPMNQVIILNKLSLKRLRLVYKVGFLGCTLLSFLFWVLYDYIYTLNLNVFMKELGTIIGTLHGNYNSPIIILQTIFYFLLFTTYNFKSEFINKISKTTLGIYLIHENIYLRDSIYDKIGLTKKIVTKKTLLYIFALAILIYFICILIELLRQYIFKVIYNTTLGKKIRNICHNYFKELNININW